jgi:16S rRNA (guanine966-N2)-methyltransferase
VERSDSVLTTLRRNAEALGVADAVELRRGEAGAVLGRLAGGARFDLAFLDPPYASDRLAAALHGLAAGALLAPDAVVVAESDRRHPPGAIEGLAVIDERRYGDTLITWFVPRGSATAAVRSLEASDA